MGNYCNIEVLLGLVEIRCVVIEILCQKGFL